MAGPIVFHCDEIRPLYPEWHDHVYAIALGYRWVAWDGIPSKRAPDYPRVQRCRQLLSPAQLASPRWQAFLKKNGGADAVGTEPLAYAYCSSGGGVDPAPALRDAELLRKLRQHVGKQAGYISAEVFAQLLEIVRAHLASQSPAKKGAR